MKSCKIYFALIKLVHDGSTTTQTKKSSTINFALIKLVHDGSPTHLFIPILYPFVNKLVKHFISTTFTFLLSALLIPHASVPYNTVGAIQIALLGLYPQSIAQHTFQRSLRYIPMIDFVYHIPFTSSTSCHLRRKLLKSIHLL